MVESFGRWLAIIKIKIQLCWALAAVMITCSLNISKFNQLNELLNFFSKYYFIHFFSLGRKQAQNRGVTIPNRNISGAGLSFALDKILGVLSASHTDCMHRIDVVVCVSGARPNFRDVTSILRTLWSSNIQCAIVQANNIEDGQDMAKDLGATYYVISTDDGTLRVRSWINDRFEERLLNRVEIIAYIQKALRPEPESNAIQTISSTESNKYQRISGTSAELSKYYSGFPLVDR